MAEHDSAISRLRSPRVCMNLVPQSWREQGMPGARCTRGLVCNSAQRNAHEHTGTDGTLRHSLRKGAYGRRKCRQIKAVRLLCSHLCRYLMLIGLRRETWDMLTPIERCEELNLPAAGRLRHRPLPAIGPVLVVGGGRVQGNAQTQTRQFVGFER